MFGIFKRLDKIEINIFSHGKSIESLETKINDLQKKITQLSVTNYIKTESEKIEKRRAAAAARQEKRRLYARKYYARKKMEKANASIVAATI
jgi:hypothetical protein